MKFKLWQAVLIGILAVLAINFIANGTTAPEVQSVAEVNNSICTNATIDCPCWGNISNTQAYGIGSGECISGTCDMTYCVDVQPVGEWLRDNPFQWIKDNIVLAAGIALLIILGLMLPKR